MAEPSAQDKQRFEDIKKELILALPKKRALDKELAQIEVQLYQLEGTYLTETAQHSGGNIIQGFDGYLKNQTSTSRRRYEATDVDRIFSGSSLSCQKSLDLLGEGDESTATAADDIGKQLTASGHTVVIVPPAPKDELTAAQLKKQRDREYQRKKRAGTRRSGTGSDDESVVSTSLSRRPTKRSRMADD